MFRILRWISGDLTCFGGYAIFEEVHSSMRFGMRSLKRLWFYPAILASVFVFAAPLYAQEGILPVENWRKVAEQRHIFNKTSGVGLVWRLYIDPSQHFGAGATLSVVRRNGEEELFWKGWNLYTENGRYALLFENSFIAQQRKGPLTDNMITLGAMVGFVKDVYGDAENLKNLMICLMDEHGGVLTVGEDKKVCYAVDFTK